MKLEDLYSPASLVRLMNEALEAKMAYSENEPKGKIFISEMALVELFLRAGAISVADVGKMNAEYEAERPEGKIVKQSCDNQYSSGYLPASIVEDCEMQGENLLRAIMNHKNLSLKEVAVRYGGKSGAANLANFMAKTNAELAQMRDSTLLRLAEALDCPESWLMAVREFQAIGDEEEAGTRRSKT